MEVTQLVFDHCSNAYQSHPVRIVVRQRRPGSPSPSRLEMLKMAMRREAYVDPGQRRREATKILEEHGLLHERKDFADLLNHFFLSFAVESDRFRRRRAFDFEDFRFTARHRTDERLGEFDRAKGRAQGTNDRFDHTQVKAEPLDFRWRAGREDRSADRARTFQLVFQGPDRLRLTQDRDPRHAAPPYAARRQAGIGRVYCRVQTPTMRDRLARQLNLAPRQVHWKTWAGQAALDQQELH